MAFVLPFVIETQLEAQSALLNTRRIRSTFQVGVELRVDYAQEEIDLEQLISSARKFDFVCVTARHKSESGPDSSAGWKGTEDERFALFERAARAGAHYIDVEAQHYRPFDQGQAKIVLSTHSFHQPFTPAQLEECGQRAEDVPFHALKVAGVVRSWEETYTLIDWCRRQSDEEKNCIVAVMQDPDETTPFGPVGRLAGLFFTGGWMYVRNGQGTAIGQIAYQDAPAMFAKAFEYEHLLQPLSPAALKKFSEHFQNH